MLAEEKAKRQKELEKLIYLLSEKLLQGENEVRDIVLKLDQLYKNGFMHSYSGFFPIILAISEQTGKDSKGEDHKNYSIDCLSENLELLRAFVEADYVSGEKKYGWLYVSLEKLYDHLSLEIGRLNYYSKNENKIEDLVAKTISLNDKLGKARDEVNAVADKARSIQIDVISVLSIFSGIVFTFSGGLSFLGSAITAINKAKCYEMVVLMAIICGMVVFNTIFLLMYLVGKITNRNIYASCKTEKCTCEKPCNGVDKIRKRLPYVFYFNFVCILGIAIDLVLWYFDIRDWFYL